jgi:hypothetical protein
MKWTRECYRINSHVRYSVTLNCIDKNNIYMVKGRNLTSENSSLYAYWFFSLIVTQNRLDKRVILLLRPTYVGHTTGSIWLAMSKYDLFDMSEWLCIWINLIWTEIKLLSGINIWHNRCGLKSPNTFDVYIHFWFG